MQRGRGERVDSMLDDVEANRSLAREWGIRAAVFVPLRVRGESIGAIAVNDRDGRDPRFSDADFRLVEAFAERAAIAIDLSRRVNRDLVSRILDGQEAERKRIARELHDETAQALTAILLGLKPFEATDQEATAELRELVRDALANVRKLSVDLRPSALDDFGLVAALERFTADFGHHGDVQVSFRPDRLDARLPEAAETALYRVTQEAVANALRHGHPQNVDIVLERLPATVRLTVTDDGRGFDAERVPPDRLGLLGMRERLTLVGGSLTVSSKLGQGTTVAAEIPA
jgi:signal transduction histidine kinase